MNGPGGNRNGRGRGSCERLFDLEGQGDYGAPGPGPGSRNSNSNQNLPPRGNQGGGYGNQGGGGQRPYTGWVEGQTPGSQAQLVIRDLKQRVRDVRKLHDEVVNKLNYSQQQNSDLVAQARAQDNNHKREVARLKKEAEYYKRLRQAAERRAAGMEQQLAVFERHAQGVDEAQTGLIQETQVLMTHKAELATKLKQTEGELAMQRETVTQLTDQLYSLQAENAELKEMYDKMMQAGQLMLTNPVAHWPEDDLDRLYVDDDGYLGTGPDGLDSSPGEGPSPAKDTAATEGEVAAEPASG